MPANMAFSRSFAVALSMVPLVVACDERAMHREAPHADAAVARPDRCLSIVAWNDMHGQLTPDEALLDTGRVPAGGVVAVADQVAAIRDTGDAVVVLDAGDMFTGPLESTIAEGAPIVDAYDVIGVDAVALGNHDFDFGPVGYARVVAPAGVGDEAGDDGPRGALLQRMATAHYPFLSANIHRAGGAAPGWAHHSPSARIDRDGWHVGVVGYTTKETPTTTLKPNVADLEFADAAPTSIATAIRALRASGSAPVVLLAHASIEGDLPQRLDDPSDPDGVKRVGELATLLSSLGEDLPDVVVAGHRHAWMLGRLRGVPIVSSDQHGVGLARIRYCPGERAPELQSIERRVAMASTPPSSALGVKVQEAIAPWIEKVKDEANAPVATLPKTCLPQGLNGTAFGEQVARAVSERVGDAAPAPNGVPVVALVNSGGLRAPLLSGVLRFSDLFAAFPFENAVASCSTTKAGLTRIVENAIKRPSVRERFPFAIAGARVVLKRRGDGGLDLVRMELSTDEKKKPAGKKGATDDAAIWLAIPDFLLWGGDGLMEGVTCAKSSTSATRVRDAWRAVLAREQGGCDGAPKNIVVEGP